MERVSLHRVLVFVLLAAIVVSAGLLIPKTVNYLEYYVALSRLDLKVDWFSFTRLSANSTDSIVGGQVSLFHNSSYVGLRVYRVDMVVYYGDSYFTLFSRRLPCRDAPLEPFSRLNLSLGDATFVEDFPRFVNFNVDAKQQGLPVVLRVESRVALYMFGNPFPEPIDLDVVEYTLPEYVT
jgi:hypothetical protein